MCDGSCGRRGLSRRAFLADTSMAAVAAVLASACGNGVFGGALGPGGVVNLSVDVNSFPALSAVGGVARVDGGSGTPVAVYHSGADTYRAYSMVCPHAGTTVNIQSNGFRCPNHGATFAVTGVWTGGQKTSNLFELTTAYDPATGLLQISGNAPGGGGGGGEDDD
ncbi:MAG TPA: Rieske 2Fe-2S domain-containing protein [Gemmatimonadales bacterium]|nr:Rieske 2Fe-2S domain-containing protein [Gemmatimonadales bacterium]